MLIPKYTNVSVEILNGELLRKLESELSERECEFTSDRVRITSSTSSGVRRAKLYSSDFVSSKASAKNSGERQQLSLVQWYPENVEDLL